MNPMNPSKHHAWLYLVALACLPTHATTTPLDWVACPPSDLPRPGACPRPGPAPISETVECARVVVPLDHGHSSPGDHTLDVCRLQAPQATRRGTLLLLPDEIDESPGDALRRHVGRWRASQVDGWNEIGHAFDVVTVAPRGPTPGPDANCVASGGLGELHPHRRFGIDTSEANLTAAANRAQLIAFVCGDDPGAAFAGIRQRVGDLDAVHQRLGSRIDAIVAVGQGAWTAARYLAIHPHAVRRALLVRPVDFTNTRWGLMNSAIAARGEHYATALSRLPATTDPVAAFGDLPEWFRLLTDDHIAHPYMLRNAFDAGRCMAAASSWTRRYCVHAYGGSGADYMPAETAELIAAPPREPRENLLGSGHKTNTNAFARDYLARACVDDDSLRAPVATWKRRIVDLGRTFPLAQYSEGFAGLVCTHWPVPPTPVHPTFGDTPVMALRWRHDDNALHADIVKAMEAATQGDLVVDEASATHAHPDDGVCSAAYARDFLLDGRRPATSSVACGGD